MNPCKICIVQACCTEECQSYRSFRKIAVNILVFISLLLSLVSAGSLVIYLLEFYPNKEHAKEILQWVWAASLIFNISFSKYNLDGLKPSIIFEVLCGPFCTAIYTFMYIGARILKRA